MFVVFTCFSFSNQPNRYRLKSIVDEVIVDLRRMTENIWNFKINSIRSLRNFIYLTTWNWQEHQQSHSYFNFMIKGLWLRLTYLDSKAHNHSSQRMLGVSKLFSVAAIEKFKKNCVGSGLHKKWYRCLVRIKDII